MPTEEQVLLAVETFSLLADPTRVKVLWALQQGEASVGRLADIVGASPTAVSQQLAKLRLARLVRTRREGAYVHYSMHNAHVRELLAQALSHADHEDCDLADHADQHPAGREDGVAGVAGARP